MRAYGCVGLQPKVELLQARVVVFVAKCRTRMLLISGQFLFFIYFLFPLFPLFLFASFLDFSLRHHLISITRAVMRYWNEEGARGQRKRALTKALASPVIETRGVL